MTKKVIGLIPAAGQGTRISPLPMSKELFPIGFQRLSNKEQRPKVACQYLLEAMKRSGIEQAFCILSPGKWDIPKYIGDGSQLGMHIGYLTVHVPFGVPFSLNQAYPFSKDAYIAMGFPDLLFSPENAFEVLINKLDSSSADVVLGLFPAFQPEKVGLVDVDSAGIVSGIYEKSTFTHLNYMWALAVWKPSFSDFLNHIVKSELENILGNQSPVWMKSLPKCKELPIGDVFVEGMKNGLQVEAVTFQDGRYLDIGTPENLVDAVYNYNNPNI